MNRSKNLRRRGHERYINDHNRESVSGVVHRAQHPDDPGRFSSHRCTPGGGNRSESIGRQAACFQRRGPLVFAWHTRSAGGIVWELLLGILYVLVGTY
jgi:hypothetical protein